ncbi:MAG: hypothetical protein AAGI07_19000, partial [Bacteroidota bacterium]
ARTSRNKNFIVLVDSLIDGTPGVVFNTLSSMLLHHLIVERRIEDAAELIQHFLKGAGTIYESIGQEVRAPTVCVLGMQNSSLELEYTSTGPELFYVQQEKHKIISGGKAENAKVNESVSKVSKLKGKIGASIYLVSHDIDTNYKEEQGGNTTSLKEILMKTYSLDFMRQQEKVMEFFRGLVPEKPLDNTLIFGLNL